ncbi:carboxymuconolactone decarboxylase family protein [Sphingobacterium sp. JB170]|uniref:carboxymuconolactone decarboxylase family protein n=1 Tax=Sphingobacterium sp. JB170 TaxID=1434842 RepID=UPI00211AA977|nr:carboxymuconolactone decarboxylase family protein [Sphingobacterium sp. JB170]
MESERFKKGWQKLMEVDGALGEKVINGLKDVSPDLGKYIIEYSFGDIYSREALGLKSKEIAVVAALTAMGNAAPQLQVHLNGALNTGSSINELKEVILQMSVYSGFPSCINAMNMLKEVLAERRTQGVIDSIGETATNISSDRLELGKKVLSSIDNSIVDKLKNAYDDISPELTQFVMEYAYADIFSRKNLDRKFRQIATIAALTALGNAASQLKFHINAGLNIGLTVEEVKEIMLLMTVYAGFPAAINGTNSLKEVVEERVANK